MMKRKWCKKSLSGTAKNAYRKLPRKYVRPGKIPKATAYHNKTGEEISTKKYLNTLLMSNYEAFKVYLNWKAA